MAGGDPSTAWIKPPAGAAAIDSHWIIEAPQVLFLSERFGVLGVERLVRVGVDGREVPVTMAVIPVTHRVVGEVSPDETMFLMASKNPTPQRYSRDDVPFKTQAAKLI